MNTNTVGNETQVGYSSQSTPRKANDALGKDEFLNLLVTQLRYQNPMEPMEDKEFIAQMAQFSSLEQMQNMNTTILASLNQMYYMNGTLLSTQASNMIGKEITWTDSEKQEHTGVVSAVQITDGVLQLKVGTKTALMDQVTAIKAAAKEE